MVAPAVGFFVRLRAASLLDNGKHLALNELVRCPTTCRTRARARCHGRPDRRCDLDGDHRSTRALLDQAVEVAKGPGRQSNRRRHRPR